MSGVIVSCEAAPIPADALRMGEDGSRPTMLSISHTGAASDLNLCMQSLASAVLATLGSHASDLIRIAAYVYAADQSIRRGSEHDVYGKHWRRRFSMYIPVSDPAHWNQEWVRSQLAQTVGFISEDVWDFCFTQAQPELEQLPLELTEQERWANPDSVILVSGGTDSLCAVVKALQEGTRPLLLSHRSTPIIDSRQQRLVDQLRRRFPHWELPHISMWIHRRGGDAVETTQRTRGFLYAAMGAAVAAQLNLTDVRLADNGIVSLNIPINAQLVGALASRSTHPKFIGLFNGLMPLLFSSGTIVTNPLWNKTRPEALEYLKVSSVTDLLQESVSCAHTRGGTVAHPHCGTCSQCVDRRFGTLAAQLEEHDISERYEVDIFSDELQEGNPRTLVESYVRFATDVEASSPEELFEKYPQFYDCILSSDSHPEKTALALVEMLKRHAANVLRVTADQIARHSLDIVKGTLPSTCLIRLVSAGQHDAHHRVPEAKPEKYKPLADFSSTDVKEALEHLAKLENLPTGEESASAYHDLALKLIKFVFQGRLRGFESEYVMDQRLGRIDIICDNYAQDGLFVHLRAELNASHVPMECKNYSSSLGNNEFNQLSNRLGPSTSRLGFLFCREITDARKMAQHTARRWMRQGNCILLFDDHLLEQLVRLRIEDGLDGVERELQKMIRDVKFDTEPRSRKRAPRTTKSDSQQTAVLS
jgi:7-cyano-7-deazaguanine synthase in queuosine biosynthesis